MSTPVGALDRWRTVGLTLHVVWAVLLVGAVLLWVRVAFLGGADVDTGAARLFGGPFALLALGILWWVWRSSRTLRAGRREGWTLPLALGGVAVAQAVMTGMPLLAASRGGGGGSLGWVVAVIATGAALGVLSLGASLMGRRAWDRALSE
ncbi:hypothetical protein [Oryzobacter telluris]|uniref:hypothetical protein n=1 Tax=Oryzobacter telluris TaxID=3149179 RepID=UPI00370D0730